MIRGGLLVLVILPNVFGTANDVFGSPKFTRFENFEAKLLLSTGNIASSVFDAHFSWFEIAGGFLHDQQTALGQHEFGAFVQKRKGYSLADACSTTCNESNPVFEFHELSGLARSAAKRPHCGLATS